MGEICFGCFANLAKAGVCPICGYDPGEDVGKYPSALSPGTILNNRYILGRVLGQGGFGITYAAQDFETKQRVAVKEFLPTAIAAREVTGRVSSFGVQQENFEHGKEGFMEEANALVDFKNNPHIVNIHDFFEANGTAYFVMEYVQGRNLKSYVKMMGGRLGEEEANRILLPIMEALQEVHSKGLVHRDIAPDNIIVTSEGSAKLIDFGAARYSTGEKSLSLDVVLKHGYAPVEQYTRRGRQGPFTDVYAMAATYYYAVTGRVPQDSVERVSEDNLIAPSALGIKLSPHVEDALFKALEVQQNNRYRSMGDFANALRGAEAAPAASVKAQDAAGGGNPLLVKAAAYLKEGKWAQAELCCDTVLDTEPGNTEALLFKRMIELEKANAPKPAKAKPEKVKQPKPEKVKPPKPEKPVKEKLPKAEKPVREESPKPEKTQGRKGKKPLVFALAALFIAAVAIASVFALKPKEPETPPPWSFDAESGVLTLRGSGTMAEAIPEYRADLRPWGDFAGEICSVVIEEGITDIAPFAFSDCVMLESVQLPESLSAVGSHAFKNCQSLKSVQIPANVTEMGESVFEMCVSLQEASLPEGITSISARLFYGCTALERANIPGSVTEIGRAAFAMCSSLENPTLHTGLIRIGDYAFSGCESIEEITLPSDVTHVGSYAFEGCSALKKFVIPYGVKEIGAYAFSDCSSLTMLKVPGSVTSLGGGALHNCTGIREFTIPAGISTVKSHMFDGCTALTRMVIPEGVTELGEYAFANCTGLSEVYLPASLTECHYTAFAACVNLLDVYYPLSRSDWDGNLKTRFYDSPNAEMHYNYKG